jgi:hypothetical protein
MKNKKEDKTMKIAICTIIGVMIGTLVASIILPLVMAIASLPIPWNLLVALLYQVYEIL